VYKKTLEEKSMNRKVSQSKNIYVPPSRNFASFAVDDGIHGEFLADLLREDGIVG